MTNAEEDHHIHPGSESEKGAERINNSFCDAVEAEAEELKSGIRKARHDSGLGPRLQPYPNGGIVSLSERSLSQPSFSRTLA